MDCKFIVGQRVVSIYLPRWKSRVTRDFVKGPEKDEICKIMTIWVDQFDGFIGLALAGYDPTNYYCHSDFRPLHDRPKEASIEVFNKLLNPAHKVLEKTP